MTNNGQNKIAKQIKSHREYKCDILFISCKSSISYLDLPKKLKKRNKTAKMLKLQHSSYISVFLPPALDFKAK